MRTRSCYVTTPNPHYQTRSCSCQSKARANEMIDEQIADLSKRTKELIALKIEIRPSYLQVRQTAYHFGMTGKLAVYAYRRIRKHWREL